MLPHGAAGKLSSDDLHEVLRTGSDMWWGSINVPNTSHCSSGKWYDGLDLRLFEKWKL